MVMESKTISIKFREARTKSWPVKLTENNQPTEPTENCFFRRQNTYKQWILQGAQLFSVGHYLENHSLRSHQSAKGLCVTQMKELLTVQWRAPFCFVNFALRACRFISSIFCAPLVLVNWIRKRKLAVCRCRWKFQSQCLCLPEAMSTLGNLLIRI